MDKVLPIAAIALITSEDGKRYPAAQILNHDQDVPFNSVIVLSCCIALYEAFINHVPECQQLEFEKVFKESFMSVFENRAEFMVHIKTENIKDK